MESPIRYVPHQSIDKKKWDECIDRSSNGLIYGYSYYLDRMAGDWDGLIAGDYETVMPLTWRKKFGFHYLYQPFLTAQLGLFGNDIDDQLAKEFVHAIPARFRYIDISLNSGNPLRSLQGSIRRVNYLLDLHPAYKSLQQQYSENIKRNIRKAEQAGCAPVNGFDAEQVIQLAVSQMKSQSKETKENVNRFRELYSFLFERKQAMTYGIQVEKQIVSSAIFFYSRQRAYYILVGNHPEGKSIGASHMLIDSFIRDHAGKNLTLDFEGSDIPSLALFYRSFGAKEIGYPHLRLNRLPFYLKWLKR